MDGQYISSVGWIYPLAAQVVVTWLRTETILEKGNFGFSLRYLLQSDVQYEVY